MTTEFEDLKSIIGEVIVRKDDEPEVFVCRGRKNVAVYQDIYYCSLSQSIIGKNDVFDVHEGYAMNEHIVIGNQHPSFNLKKVIYIIARNTKGYHCIPFIFNIQDMRKHYLYAATMLCDFLPKELVDLVMWYLGCSKPKDKYTVKDFPFNFESEYKGTVPSFISREQLKTLYNLGMVKMAISLQPIYTYIALTEESFDYVYPNNKENRLSNHFGTKEAMYKYIQNILETFLLI